MVRLASLLGLLSSLLLVPAPARATVIDPCGAATASSGPLDILLAPLISLRADGVLSSAHIDGEFGALGSSGSASILNGVLTVGLLPPIALASNPAPNTVVFDALGITVTLNEQIASGNGIDAMSLLVNAIHIEFTDAVLGVCPLNGHIIVSHAEAALQPVPEPGSGFLLGFGALGLAVAGRRRQSRR